MMDIHFALWVSRTLDNFNNGCYWLVIAIIVHTYRIVYQRPCSLKML